MPTVHYVGFQPILQGLPEPRSFNTLPKSIWNLFWVLFIFFLVSGAYKCNLRAYMMMTDKEKPVETAEVSGNLVEHPEKVCLLSL